MLRGLLTAFAAVAHAKTTWYAGYDLSSSQIETLTSTGCYRGVYGGLKNADFHNSRSMSLYTCPLTGTDVPFAELEDNAFMCVVELTDPQLSEKALGVVAAHGHTTALFVGQHEFIITSSNSTIQHEKPELCSPVHFNGLVDNTLFVPRQSVVAQDPVPVDHPAYIRSMTNKTSLAPNDYIASLLAQFDRQRSTDFVRTLSTGPDGTNTRITRNSYAIRAGAAGCLAGWKCAHDSTTYVVDTLNNFFRDNNYPGQYSVYTNTFRNDMCANVILDIVSPRNPSRWILTGAHLDSRNTGSGPTATGIAPGADDNGTGSAVHLELARLIAVNRVQFEYSIRLMWFCGEEQGLLGSAALATAYAAQNPRLDVIGMFNMDMIGYTNPPSGVVLSFMTGSATLWLSQSCQEFSKTYIPSMAVGFTQACCSDQQSFFSRGFAAAGIFETPTARVVYPYYHMPTDQWDMGGINYEQVWNFGKAISACAMEYAVPIAPSSE